MSKYTLTIEREVKGKPITVQSDKLEDIAIFIKSWGEGVDTE